MANTRDIKRKITSVQNTQKITKVMKMVSAAKMRKSVELMLSGRSYASKMRNLVIDLRNKLSETSHPYLLGKPEIKNIGLIIITADKGLCGAFNSNVIKAVLAFVSNYGKDKKISTYIVGKKAYDFYKRRDIDISEKWIEFSGKYSYGSASEIASFAVKDFNNDKIDELHIIYNFYKSTATQEVHIDKILPVELKEKDSASKLDNLTDIIFEPSKEIILERLLPKYINTSVFQALLESSAGEHGARMIAMENATRAAGDMIKRLVLYYNKARQDAITKELLDIVNGAEALK